MSFDPSRITGHAVEIQKFNRDDIGLPNVDPGYIRAINIYFDTNGLGIDSATRDNQTQRTREQDQSTTQRTRGNSGGSDSVEDTIDSIEDDINDAINGFSEDEYREDAQGDYVTADGEALENYLDLVQRYTNFLMMLALLLDSRNQLTAIVAESFTEEKTEVNTVFLKAVTARCQIALQQSQAQVAQFLETLAEENAATYGENSAAIEEEYKGMCDSQTKKYEELTAELERYERATKKIAHTLASALSQDFSVNLNTASTEDITSEIEALCAEILASAAELTPTTTENGYYDIDAGRMEELRNSLLGVQNLMRCQLMLQYTKSDLRQAVFQAMTGKQGYTVRKELVDTAVENKFAADIQMLDLCFNTTLNIVKIHNEKVFNQKQVEKLEAQLGFKIGAWICRGISALCFIAGCLVNVIPLFGQIGCAVLWGVAAVFAVLGEGFELAGEIYADGKVDDSLDITGSSYQAEDPDDAYAGDIPTTAGEQKILDYLNDVGYTEEDDGLLYLDTTEMAKMLGDLNTMQTITRMKLALQEAKFDIKSVVLEEFTGRAVEAGDFSLVQSSYEAQFRQYAFMFQVRDFILEQNCLYQNRERIQAKNLENAYYSFIITSFLSILGAACGGGALGAFLSAVFSALGSVLSEYLESGWALDYDQLETDNTFTLPKTETGGGGQSDSMADNLDHEEQRLLQKALEAGLMETGDNGFGMAYYGVDPALTIIIRQQLARIQNLRLCLWLLQDAKAQLRDAARTAITGKSKVSSSTDLMLQNIVSKNQIVGQQVQYILNFRKQQAQLMNNAADAHKQFWQSCIVSGISVGLSALGWGLSKIPALGNIAEELLAGGSAAGNILSRGGKMAFDAIDANRDYGIMETMDPQQIVLRALKRHAEATGQVFEISAEELKVLTQITQELINSMQYGTWGINSGLYDYFTSLMETVYRIQEMLFMLGQTKHKIRSEARQTVSGKAISSASLDASTLLSADSTKALGFVSDLFSGLEMIVEQHNKMVAAEREMYLDLLDIATTTATSMVNLKLQGASADLEKMTKEAEDLAALENTAVENNASDETLETIRTQYLDKQQEIGALELEIQGQKNTYSLMSIAQPWVRMLVGAGIDKLLTREHQKESVTIKVDTTSSDELTNMEQKALAASLSQGTSAQQSTTTATSHERWQQVTDASWDAVVEIAKYVATQIDNKYKNEAAVVESQQEEYINKCEDAVRTAKQLEEMLTSLQTPLDDNPENVRATIETVQALGQEAARLQEQIEIAEASKYEARKYSEEAKQGKVSLTLPASSGQAQLTQFQTELQQASTALQAYLETLIAQTADTKEGSPTTAPQNPAEAKATAEESLTVLQQSASQVFESEAVMAGLSHLVAPEDATRIQQTIISSDGRPIESLSEEENWAILGRDRLLLAGLTENNQQEAVQRLQGRVDELQRAIDQVLAGKDMVPKGIKSGDYVKMLQAEKERVMEQIAQAKSGSKWDAIKGVACEMNSITYILRMQIRTRLSNPQQTPANHPNRITGSMTALEVLGCIDREFDAQMAARFGITMPAGASTPMLAPVTNPRGQAEQLVPEDMPATESEPISEDVSDEFSALENELDEALVQLSTRSSEAILQGYLEQKRLRAATRAAENRATAELADLDSQDLPALQALLADQTQQESEIKDQLEQYDVALATMVQDLACDPATLEAVNQNLTGWLGSLSSLKGEILC